MTDLASETIGSASTGVLVAICACCGGHDDYPLTWQVVTCRECGTPCSCLGCVAEADDA